MYVEKFFWSRRRGVLRHLGKYLIFDLMLSAMLGNLYLSDQVGSGSHALQGQSCGEAWLES
jgi:hypothetical protein